MPLSPTELDAIYSALLRLGKAVLAGGPPDDIGPPVEVEQEYYEASDAVKFLAVKLAEEHGSLGLNDLPLRAKLEGDELVIRIGVDTLVFAAENCQRFYDYDKHVPEGPYVKVIDKAEFARDIVRAMHAEEEDGSTPLSDFIDQMFIDAWEDGSAGFDYKE